MPGDIPAGTKAPAVPQVTRNQAGAMSRVLERHFYLPDWTGSQSDPQMALPIGIL